MRKTVKDITATFMLLTLVAFWLYDKNQNPKMLTTAIILFTTSYHFLMRCIVGFSFDRLKNNKADYTSRWYQEKDWERELYTKLKVKQWKCNIPTFEPELFDVKKHSIDEIAQASCQAELVHETIAILSLVPIYFSKWFGAPKVFLFTSILAASIEMIFVIVQRFNRPRLMKILNRKFNFS